jgi:hypothetical protein
MNSRRGSTSSPISCENSAVGVDRVVDLDLQQRAGIRIERRFPQLLGVHLAKALVALQVRPLRPKAKTGRSGRGPEIRVGASLRRRTGGSV